MRRESYKFGIGLRNQRSHDRRITTCNKKKRGESRAMAVVLTVAAGRKKTVTRAQAIRIFQTGTRNAYGFSCLALTRGETIHRPTSHLEYKATQFAKVLACTVEGHRGNGGTY